MKKTGNNDSDRTTPGLDLDNTKANEGQKQNKRTEEQVLRRDITQ